MVGTLKQILLAKCFKQFFVPMETVTECFTAKEKMNKHLRDNHLEPLVQTSDSSETETEKKIKGTERTAKIP